MGGILVVGFLLLIVVLMSMREFWAWQDRREKNRR